MMPPFYVQTKFGVRICFNRKYCFKTTRVRIIWQNQLFHIQETSFLRRYIPKHFLLICMSKIYMVLTFSTNSRCLCLNLLCSLHFLWWVCLNKQTKWSSYRNVTRNSETNKTCYITFCFNSLLLASFCLFFSFAALWMERDLTVYIWATKKVKSLHSKHQRNSLI